MAVSPVPESFLPKVGGVGFGDAKLVTGKDAVGEDGLELREHMAEDEAEFGQVPAVMRRLVEHLFLAFLEQLDGLLALAHQVVDEDAEVLVGVEDVHAVLVLAVDEAQSLVRVG